MFIDPDIVPRILQVSNGSHIRVQGRRIYIADIIGIATALVTHGGHARLRIVVVHLREGGSITVSFLAVKMGQRNQ